MGDWTPKTTKGFNITSNRVNPDSTLAYEWLEQFTNVMGAPVFKAGNMLSGHHPEGLYLPLAQDTYNLTLGSHLPFTPRVITDKAQPLQDDGFNCGIYTIYSAIIRNAAQLGETPFKSIGLPLIEEYCSLQILTAEQANQIV